MTCSHEPFQADHRDCKNRLFSPHQDKSSPTGGCGCHKSIASHKLQSPGWHKQRAAGLGDFAHLAIEVFNGTCSVLAEHQSTDTVLRGVAI